MTNDRPTPRVLCWVPLPPPYGGPEVASEALMKELTARRPGVTVRNANLRSSIQDRGQFDLSGLVGFVRAWFRFLWALLASRCSVVVIVLSSSTMGFLRDAALIWTARLFLRRVVVHLRGSNYENFYKGKSAPLRFLIRRAWRRAARGIVQSPRLSSQLQSSAPSVPVSVLPNGLDEKAYPPKDTYAASGPVTLLFVGYLSFTKGFYDLIGVFLKLRATYPQLKLRFAGERPKHGLRNFQEFLSPEARAAYVAKADEISAAINDFIDHAAERQAEYLGIISGPSKEEALRSADLFVLPSYAEGFSVAVLEAMMSGLPVVTTTVGAMPDVLSDGVNGCLVAPGDAAALEQKLRMLIDQAPLRERMGRENARAAREKYALSRVAGELSAILDATT